MSDDKPKLVARDLTPPFKKVSMSTQWSDEKLRALTPEQIETLPADVWQKVSPRLAFLRMLDKEDDE